MALDHDFHNLHQRLLIDFCTVNSEHENDQDNSHIVHYFLLHLRMMKHLIEWLAIPRPNEINIMDNLN